MNCGICSKLSAIPEKTPSGLIIEWEHSIVFTGDHQFYPGYCVVFFKEHVRELHEITHEKQFSLWTDVIKVGSAISKLFNPWKLNYASLGNQDAHVHWHIFPRYESDPNHRLDPWANKDKFAAHILSESENLALAQRIRKALH